MKLFQLYDAQRRSGKLSFRLKVIGHLVFWGFLVVTLVLLIVKG